MMAQTSPLSQQLDLKPASMNNNGSRGMMLRQMLPNLLINAVLPFLINFLAQPHMSTINALLLASSVPAVFTLGNFLVKKHVDALGLLVVAGLLLSAVFALIFNSPRLLLLQGSAINGLFGVALLVSLLFPRPILFYIVRSIMAQNDAQRIARFNADWAFPQFRTCYRTLTIVWGCLTVAQVILHAVLIFSLPISLMLVLNPILGFGFILPAAHWSMSYFRKNRRTFEQLRQQRDAAAKVA